MSDTTIYMVLDDDRRLVGTVVGDVAAEAVSRHYQVIPADDSAEVLPAAVLEGKTPWWVVETGGEVAAADADTVRILARARHLRTTTGKDQVCYHGLGSDGYPMLTATIWATSRETAMAAYTEARDALIAAPQEGN